MKKILFLFLFTFFFFQIGSVFAAEITTTKTTQTDWTAGRYENKDVNISTSSGNLQLALDWGSWDASGPANINHAIGQVPSYPYYGNTKVLKVNRYLYTFRNTSYGQFLRYDLDTREWKEMAYVPTEPYEVLDATTDGSSKIWAFATRSNRKHFLEYDIATNTWVYLPNISDLLGQGATLEYVPGTTSYVYAFRGGVTDFFRYHINGAQAGTWQAIANPTSPYGAASCGTYCDLTYDGSRYLYLVSDSASPDRLYKYDTWNLGSAWPYTAMSSNGLVGLGSDMVKVGNDYYMLATPGNGGAPQQALYKYNGTAWSASTAPPYPIVFGSLTYDEESGKIIALTDVGNLMYFNPSDGKWSYPLKGPPLNTYVGNSMMTSNGSTNIYQCRAQNTAVCYSYTIGTNAWSSAITYSTGTLGDGSAMAYLGGLNYVGRGGTTSFYSVNPTTGAATTLAVSTNAFSAGSAIVASGSANLYVLHGNSTVFRRYVVGTGWTTLAVFPEAAGRGAGLARIGDFTYGTSGNFRGRFYRYSETANSWTEMASIPVAVYNGGAMASDGTRYIYLQSGGENDMTGRNYYRYDSVNNIWERLADTPNMIRYGGGLTYVSGALYSYQGFNNAFWKYTPKTTNNYTTSGTWYSPEYDLGYASSFTSFSSSFAPASGVSDSVLFYSRTSSNKNMWSDWELTDTTITSPAGRYLQIKAALTGKADGSVSPVVDSFTFGYNDDTTPPVVTGLNLQAYGTSAKTISLTTGGTYNHRNPYFEWTGATDSESGMDGYYVYFGNNNALDPVTSGTFQQTTDYVVSSGLVSGSTYYLKVKAKNKAGYSSASTTFSFVYQGISPVATSIINTQLDWDDAQASKSAVYTSTVGWWNQAYQYRQQLDISPAATATAGSMIRVTLDTAALVAADKLRSDRKDWRIIYSNGTTLEEIDRDYVGATTTYFPLKKAVNAGTSTSQYYVYYGNPNETTEPLSDLAHSYAAAKWGSAMWYDGGNDYTRFNNATPFIHGLSQLTVEGWFKYQNTA